MYHCYSVGPTRLVQRAPGLTRSTAWLCRTTRASASMRADGGAGVVVSGTASHGPESTCTREYCTGYLRYFRVLCRVLYRGLRAASFPRPGVRLHQGKAHADSLGQSARADPDLWQTYSV